MTNRNQRIERTVQLLCLAMLPTAMVSCVTLQNMSSISSGQSKAEVQAIMGSPQRTPAVAGNESWSYYLKDNTFDAINTAGLQKGREQIIVFRNGHVMEWGNASQVRSSTGYSNSSRYLHGRPVQ